MKLGEVVTWVSTTSGMPLLLAFRVLLASSGDLPLTNWRMVSSGIFGATCPTAVKLSMIELPSLEGLFVNLVITGGC